MPVLLMRGLTAIRTMIAGSEKKLFILINKTDLLVPEAMTLLKEQIFTEKGEVLLFISAKEKSGLDQVRLNLGQVVVKENFNSDNVIITNIRHYEILLKVSESLSRVESGLDSRIPEDLIAIDLRHAIHFLGEITGEITTDELLGNIFRNFCIGK